MLNNSNACNNSVCVCVCVCVAGRPLWGEGVSSGAVGAPPAAVRTVHGPAALLQGHGAGGQLDEQAGGTGSTATTTRPPRHQPHTVKEYIHYVIGWRSVEIRMATTQPTMMKYNVKYVLGRREKVCWNNNSDFKDDPWLQSVRFDGEASWEDCWQNAQSGFPQHLPRNDQSTMPIGCCQSGPRA